jgi:hypothetical protein
VQGASSASPASCSRRIDHPALWQQLGDYFRANIAALGELLGHDLSL